MWSNCASVTRSRSNDCNVKLFQFPKQFWKYTLIRIVSIFATIMYVLNISKLRQLRKLAKNENPLVSRGIILAFPRKSFF